MKAEAKFIQQDLIKFEVKLTMNIAEAKLLQQAVSEYKSKRWHTSLADLDNHLYNIINKVRTELESKVEQVEQDNFNLTRGT